MKTKYSILLLLLILTLASCTPKPELISVLIKQTIEGYTPIPTSTSFPTYTTYPTNTFFPTYTEYPTYTPVYIIVTATYTYTPQNTPTITPTFTKTLVPSRTPVPSSTKKPSATFTPKPVYLPLVGHVYRYVKVYYGINKAFGFTLIGASEKCSIVPSGRGLLVQYADGTLEWKDRNTLLQSDIYFVREDDPNINSMQMDYYNCP